MDKKNKRYPDDSLIHRYADGELDERKAKEFEELLDKSPELRKELDDIRAVGDKIREAVHSEVEQVNFRPVWAAVNETIEKEEQSRSKGVIYNLMELFTPRRIAVAASATAMLMLGVLIVWQFMLAPSSGEAALTAVDIQYADDLDIVISVDVLDDSVTTVVWINNFSVDEGMVEE